MSRLRGRRGECVIEGIVEHFSHANTPDAGPEKGQRTSPLVCLKLPTQVLLNLNAFPHSRDSAPLRSDSSRHRRKAGAKVVVKSVEERARRQFQENFAAVVETSETQIRFIGEGISKRFVAASSTRNFTAIVKERRASVVIIKTNKIFIMSVIISGRSNIL